MTTEERDVASEEPEGIETPSNDGWGDYPLDAVFVRTEQRTVGEVVQRISRGRYVLDPDFQRDFVWRTDKQSKLIESCVMRIPLPVFYVAEAEDGRIVVVDGLQRLTTFTRFLKDDLKLTGLVNPDRAGSHELEGRLFKDLPLNLQERVLDTQLTMYILDAKAPERARLDIFERVNSGATLTRQQMRNALYNGPATQWLRAASEGGSFRDATGGTLDNKTMRDREAINRFCAFRLLGWQSYTTGDMDGFLAKALTQLASMSNDEREHLRLDFDAAMSLNYKLFKRHAFRKSLVSDFELASRSVINISLFETCGVEMAAFAARFDMSREDHLRNIIVALVKNESFGRSITYSTNSTQAVRARFSAMAQALSEFRG